MSYEGFFKRVCVALKGYQIIKKSGGFRREEAIHFVFPDKDKIFNKDAIDNCINRIQDNNIKIAHFWLLGEEKSNKNNNEIVIHNVNAKTMKEILYFYMLSGFEYNILIISLEEPYGRFGKRLLNKMTIEDYINCIIDNKIKEV